MRRGAVALLGVAAVMLSPGCGRASGPTVQFNAAASDAPPSEGPATDGPRESLDAAAAEPLARAPEPMIEEGMYDLCDDKQAAYAGLDGGALKEDRAALGLDCSAPDAGAPRYRYLYEDGETVVVSAEERSSFTPDPGGHASPLSRLGSWALHYEAPAKGESLEVLNASVTVADGTVRGLVRNGRQKFARSVAVTATTQDGQSGVAPIPFTMQPGESAPFEIPDLPDVSAATVDLTVAATFSDAPDPRRAVRVMGAPGYWTGPVDEFPGIRSAAQALPASGTVSLFQTILQYEEPTSHPAVARSMAGTSIQPAAVVARLDEQERVIEVFEPQVFNDTGDPVGRLSLKGIALIGFETGQGDFRIWAYGR